MTKLAMALEEKEHSGCFVCSQRNQGGLKLDFQRHEDGSVEAQFYCAKAFQGYHGFLHGGIIAAMLDGAMTHCLFGQGRIAMTAELKVRYVAPIALDKMVTVRAWVEKSRARFSLLKAEIISEGGLFALAEGKFIETSAASRQRQI